MTNETLPTQIARSKPLYKQVKSIILEQIDRGELEPHDQIPSEREYSRRTGISRLTVRKALEELTLTGVLYRQPGKGTYVAPVHSSRREVRISGHTSILADTEQTTYKLLSCGTSLAPAFAVELLGIASETSVVRLVQLISVRGEPRVIHRGYIPLTIGQRLLHVRETQTSLLQLMARYCSDRAATTRDRITPGTMTKRDAELLKIPETSVAQVFIGCMLSHDGTPVEAHEVIIRGDRVKLELEFDLHP